ncbi:unnamed protein product [Dovyalis caffra]|uniref:Uncharacterized protein n=1 Tax=Dovyalis caffra TaxID=77055 RepID=A0AAV1RBS3_9ROSI|nr:unnamed protein product [Dovyalis caffra]
MDKWEHKRVSKYGTDELERSRHLNNLKTASSFKNMGYSFARLALRGIKQSGPSPSGPGHRS